MEKIGLTIFFAAFTLAFPAFAFYRGICHGKARQIQKRSERIVPAIKHTLIWAGIGAILVEFMDSESIIFDEFSVNSWLPILKKLGSVFLGLCIICGIPFTLGMLLIPQRKKT